MNDDDMCPDGDTHSADQCHVHHCENYVREIEDLAPWGSSPSQMREWAAGG